MKFLLALVLALSVSAVILGQAPKTTSSKDLIVAGVGWGVVTVNADRNIVEMTLGKSEGEEGSKYLDGVYFREYPDMGMQVSYTHKGTKLSRSTFITSNIATKTWPRLL